MALVAAGLVHRFESRTPSLPAMRPTACAIWCSPARPAGEWRRSTATRCLRPSTSQPLGRLRAKWPCRGVGDVCGLRAARRESPPWKGVTRARAAQAALFRPDHDHGMTTGTTTISPPRRCRVARSPSERRTTPGPDQPRGLWLARAGRAICRGIDIDIRPARSSPCGPMGPARHLGAHAARPRGARTAATSFP